MVREDAEELKEILAVVSAEIPKLLTAISESIFSPGQTEQYAQAVADFYKSLREAGMDEKQAFELTQRFMDRTNFAAMIQEVIAGKGIKIKKGAGREDISSAVEEAVKGKIREKLREKGIESDEE